MTDITIVSAPDNYQKYLWMGDSREGETGFDGILNDQNEAAVAADKYCGEKQADECQGFIEYLEGHGYVLAQIRTRYLQPVKHEITDQTLTEIAESVGPYKEAVRQLKEKGIINEQNIEEIKLLLIEIAKVDCSHRACISSAYSALGDLAQTGLIEKIGVQNLVEFAKVSTEFTGLTYSALGELSAKGLIEKIGISNLIKIANAVKGQSGRALPVLGQWVEKGLADKYGLDRIIDLLVGLVNANGVPPDGASSLFMKLVEKGFIEKYGFDQIKMLLIEMSRTVTDSFTGVRIYDVFGQLIDLGIVEEFGLDEVKQLLFEIAKATGRVSNPAYSALASLAGKGLIKKIGISNLIEIARDSGDKTTAAYSALKMFDENGLIERYGLDPIKSLLHEVNKTEYGTRGITYPSLEKLAEKELGAKDGLIQTRNIIAKLTKATAQKDIASYLALQKYAESAELKSVIEDVLLQDIRWAAGNHSIGYDDGAVPQKALLFVKYGFSSEAILDALLQILSANDAVYYGWIDYRVFHAFEALALSGIASDQKEKMVTPLLWALKYEGRRDYVPKEEVWRKAASALMRLLNSGISKESKAEIQKTLVEYRKKK